MYFEDAVGVNLRKMKFVIEINLNYKGANIRIEVKTF